jgi:hypothetical protein
LGTQKEFTGQTDGTVKQFSSLEIDPRRASVRDSDNYPTIVALCNMMAGLESRYVALSYVWGELDVMDFEIETYVL